MLSAIFSSLGGVIIDKFLGNALKAFEMYNNKQISMEELRTSLLNHLTDAVKAVEVSHSETLAKTFQTFWSAADADKTNLMKIMWASALGSQIFVLFWSQWCVPLLFAYGYLPNWKAGTTAEWSYLLIGGLLGLGPLVLRSGPGKLDTDKLKSMISK